MTISQELVERVRGLTGPDREVDALIAALADGRTVRENMHPEFGRQLLARNSRPPHDEYWLDHPARVNPPVTASIDAALALAESVLPGWAIDCQRIPAWARGGLPGPVWGASMFSDDVPADDMMAALNSGSAVHTAPTAPLALTLATLIAIQSSETK
jgi:hypothetical protein